MRTHLLDCQADQAFPEYAAVVAELGGPGEAAGGQARAQPWHARQVAITQLGAAGIGSGSVSQALAFQSLRMADILPIFRQGPAPGRKQRRKRRLGVARCQMLGVLGFHRLSAIRNMRERASRCDRRQ
jgi:hypothetical protein